MKEEDVLQGIEIAAVCFTLLRCDLNQFASLQHFVTDMHNPMLKAHNPKHSNAIMDSLSMTRDILIGTGIYGL